MRTLTACMAGLAISIAVTGARAGETCVPPVQQRQHGLAHFADDDGFDVQVRPSRDGSIIRVTGDTIVVDRERLSSLEALTK